MNISSKAILAALVLAIPMPAPARSSDDGRPATGFVLVDGGDDDAIQIEAPRARIAPRIHVSHMLSGRYLGIRLVGITPDLRTHFGAPKDAGVLIGEVEKDSPAARAGLEVGDVLTAVDGERVASAWEISGAIDRKATGETVKLEIVRKGSVKSLTAKIDERPRQDVELRHFGRDLGREVRRHLQVHPWAFEFDGDRTEPLLRDKLLDRVDELERRLKELEGKKSR
jgi:membrane-associated protease RseP (regulator of RpoE activity)